MDKMNEEFYIIYKTICLLNGMYYVGAHRTKDLNDGYTGSGTRIVNAISKYGDDQFNTIILEFCDDEDHMYLREEALVDHLNPMTYNIVPGGRGKIDYIAGTILTSEQRSEINRKLGRLQYKNKAGMWHPDFDEIRKNGRLGKTHSEESKQKIREDKLGRIYMHNIELNESKMIKPEQFQDFLNNGWEESIFIRMHKLDPFISTMLEEIYQPKYINEGWIPGSGYRFINKNGIILSIPLPDVEKYINEGWKKGKGTRNKTGLL